MKKSDVEREIKTMTENMKPVAWLEPEFKEQICPEVGYEYTTTSDHPSDLCWIPLYPKREWVGLTESEIYKQEPVCPDCTAKVLYECVFCSSNNYPPKEQPEQEPVAWADIQKEAQQIVESKFLWKKFIVGTPLSNDIACWMADFAQQYTTPPQPEWVGLTDDEIDEAVNSCRTLDTRKYFRAIEAKLKEKNT